MLATYLASKTEKVSNLQGFIHAGGSPGISPPPPHPQKAQISHPNIFRIIIILFSAKYKVLKIALVESKFVSKNLTSKIMIFYRTCPQTLQHDGISLKFCVKPAIAVYVEHIQGFRKNLKRGGGFEMKA